MESLWEVDVWARFLSVYAGKDKLTRTLQYGCRCMQHYLLQADTHSKMGKKLRTTYKTISNQRKAFRLGRGLDELQQYRRWARKLRGRAIDEEHLCRFVQHFCLGTFLFADNVIWAVSLKLVRVSDEKSFKKRAALFRVVAIFAQAIVLAREWRAAAVKLRNVEQRRKDGGDATVSPLGRSDSMANTAETEKLQLKQSDRQVKAVKLLCDLLTYGQASGLAKVVLGRELHDGHVGLLGVISAVVGSRSCWRTCCQDAVKCGSETIAKHG